MALDHMSILRKKEDVIESSLAELGGVAFGKKKYRIMVRSFNWWGHGRETNDLQTPL